MRTCYGLPLGFHMGSELHLPIGAAIKQHGAGTYEDLMQRMDLTIAHLWPTNTATCPNCACTFPFES